MAESEFNPPWPLIAAGKLDLTSSKIVPQDHPLKPESEEPARSDWLSDAVKDADYVRQQLGSTRAGAVQILILREILQELRSRPVQSEQVQAATTLLNVLKECFPSREG